MATSAAFQRQVARTDHELRDQDGVLRHRVKLTALPAESALLGQAVGDVNDVDLLRLRIGEVEVLAG